MTHRAWPGILIVVPTPSIGWSSDIFSAAGTFAHANTGTNSPAFYSLTPGSDDAVAGPVLVTSATVVWSLAWQSLTGDPAPTLIAQSGNKVAVRYNIGNGNFPPHYLQGLATLTATIGGVLSDAIVASFGGGYYADIAWGPAP